MAGYKQIVKNKLSPIMLIILSALIGIGVLEICLVHFHWIWIFHCRTGSGNACDVSPQSEPVYSGACCLMQGLRLSSGRLSVGAGDKKCVLSEDHEA